MKNSLLMCDSTEGDGKAEIVMDYVMSWSLRHATKEYAEKKDLYRYCRYMLYKLLQIKAPLKNIVFTDVKVWKEWQYIDLCAEVKLTNNGEEECYALLIENKYYSKLHDNQLQRYQAVFNAYYDKKNKEIKNKKDKWLLRYSLVSCFDKQKQLDELYGEGMKKTKFKGLTFYKLLCPSCWDEKSQTYKDSESDIFNEFWLRKW